jgi:hypothetical protein
MTPKAPSCTRTRTRTHSRLGRDASAWLLLIAGLLRAPVAAAEDPVAADHERFSPSVTLLMQMVTQDVNGRVQSNRRPEGSEGTPIFGDNRLIDYAFGLSFELMAPAITDSAGRPQPFVHVDVMNPLGLEIDTAREGSPNGFEIQDFNVQATEITADGVAGQGSKTETEFKSPMVTAGIGVGFSFEIFDQTIQARPSFQYFYEKVEVNGVVLDAEGRRVIEDFVLIEDFEFITLTRAQTKNLHGLGGGLEFETEMGRNRFGRFALTLGAHVYHLIGDRRFEFSASDGAHMARWKATMDPLVYRFGVGFRFRFLSD